jgi:hypothetical protein
MKLRELYEAVGWDVTTQKYANVLTNRKPILPTLIHYNTLRLRVSVKKCHGEVQTYEIQKTIWSVNPRWRCINCHRETEEMEGNAYYEQDSYRTLSYGVDKLTAAQMGGLEW